MTFSEKGRRNLWDKGKELKNTVKIMKIMVFLMIVKIFMV